MSSVNKVILVGNLGKDPEMRRLQNGNSVANFSIATSETWRDKTTGERKERSEWHRIVIFSEGLAGVAEQYLRKGSKVYIEGKLQTRKWTDQSGVEKFSTEIVLQGYDAKLVMLNKPGRGGGAAPSGDGFDDDVDFGGAPSTPPGQQGNRNARGAQGYSRNTQQGSGGFDDDLDVPF